MKRKKKEKSVTLYKLYILRFILKHFVYFYNSILKNYRKN